MVNLIFPPPRYHHLALFNYNKLTIPLSASCFSLVIIISISFFLLPLYSPSQPPSPAENEGGGLHDLLLGPLHEHHNHIPGTRAPQTFLNPPATTRNETRSFCDLSKGTWVPEEPHVSLLYTNETCPYIQSNQNCLSNARPDRDYLHWRWQPSDCSLPRLDPLSFLALMRGKRMAFIGDSLARNQMQALLCALAKVEDPYTSSEVPAGNLWNEKEYRWHFRVHNFTLGNIWSAFLMNHTADERGHFHIHLDMPDVAWSSRIHRYDVVVFSTAYWYFRPSIYYVRSKAMGASAGSGASLATLDILAAMRMTWKSVWDHVLQDYKGVSLLRTVTVPHFGERPWNEGGKCNRTRPDSDPHMNSSLPWMTSEMRKVQVEEFDRAAALLLQKEGGGGGEKAHARMKLVDVTYSASLRPDGHPGIYRIRNNNEPISDCLHWCMPGPIDTWNEMLFHALKSCHHSGEEYCA